MNLDDDDRSALLAVFEPDARERVSRLQEGLTFLVRSPDAGPPADLVREAHTLRGSAATVKRHRMVALAGELESALTAPDFERAAELADELAAELDGDRDGDVAARTVLYIEDDPTNLVLMQRIVARIPHVELISAREAREGIDLARREQPDLVLLDLVLPDLSGEEALRVLRADPATKDIPVVVLSASTETERGEALRAAGATEYVTKPFEVDELASILQRGPG